MDRIKKKMCSRTSQTSFHIISIIIIIIIIVIITRQLSLLVAACLVSCSSNIAV